jgi:hypothetical protein
MATPRETCSDCGGATHEIKLIDKFHMAAHADLEYAVADANGILGMFNYSIQGRVEATMCKDCGRIALYGAPRE